MEMKVVFSINHHLNGTAIASVPSNYRNSADVNNLLIPQHLHYHYAVLAAAPAIVTPIEY